MVSAPTTLRRVPSPPIPVPGADRSSGLPARSLWSRLARALADPSGSALEALADAVALEERDGLAALLAVYDLWMAPLQVTAGTEVHQNHPAVSALKRRLEADFRASLESRCPPDPSDRGDAVAAMRRIAAADLVPAAYDWLAQEASWPELVRFLAVEGGPDAGFDDLVAIAQVGIRNGPKVALGANYWDELGRGHLHRVHTVLHDRLVDAVEMPRIPRPEQPAAALERAAMGGYLATNRHLQPEMLGSLGMVELQAGPRCRAVVKALRRLDAPDGAFPFYEEHATADPRHGKEWLDEVVAPLAVDPAWAERMVTGARWRQEVNRRFFTDVLERFVGAPGDDLDDADDPATTG